MPTKKHALGSKTVWGGLGSVLVAMLLLLSGDAGIVDLSPELRDALLWALLPAAGLTLYGRTQARGPVRWSRSR